MLDLQRSITRSLKVHSTELAISEGNSGDASYLARLSSVSDNRKVESANLQNLVSFGQMQDAGLEKAFAITDRMGIIAGSASNSPMTEARLCKSLTGCWETRNFKPELNLKD